MRRFLSILLLAASPVAATTFHVDPVNGSAAGDGSAAQPWQSLQAVFEAGLVETRDWPEYPYEEGMALVTVNADWVTDQQRAALDRFAVFLVTGEENKLFAADGWRTPRLQTEADTAQGVVASEPRFTPSGPNAWSLAQSPGFGR